MANDVSTMIDYFVEIIYWKNSTYCRVQTNPKMCILHSKNNDLIFCSFERSANLTWRVDVRVTCNYQFRATLTRLWHALLLSMHELVHLFSNVFKWPYIFGSCITLNAFGECQCRRRRCYAMHHGRACEILIWWSDNDGSNCWFVSWNSELNTTLGKINENANKRFPIQSNRKSNNGWCKQSKKNLKRFVRCGKAMSLYLCGEFLNIII